MARLNDTAALRTPRPAETESVSVRKISNGYLICRSGANGYTEHFSAERPLIEMDPDAHGPVGEDGLAGAKAELNK